MTEKEITEGNKLIAEFMGLKERIEDAFKRGGDGYAACRYHESWDWIIPVIDKINGMGKAYNFVIFKTYVSLTVEKGGKVFKDYSFAHSEYITESQSGKEAAFKLIVKFIKWENENIDRNNE